MTNEELVQLFEDHNDEEFLKFKRIKNPLHPRPDICGFLILHNIVPGKTDIVGASEHDEIYLSVTADEFLSACVPEETEAVVIDLLRCGVLWNEDYDSFFMFT